MALAHARQAVEAHIDMRDVCPQPLGLFEHTTVDVSEMPMQFADQVWGRDQHPPLRPCRLSGTYSVRSHLSADCIITALLRRRRPPAGPFPPAPHSPGTLILLQSCVISVIL